MDIVTFADIYILQNCVRDVFVSIRYKMHFSYFFFNIYIIFCCCNGISSLQYFISFEPRLCIISVNLFYRD